MSAGEIPLGVCGVVLEAKASKDDLVDRVRRFAAHHKQGDRGCTASLLQECAFEIERLREIEQERANETAAPQDVEDCAVITSLARWLIHEDGCDAIEGPAFKHPCTCGLDEAITAVNRSAVKTSAPLPPVVPESVLAQAENPEGCGNG